MDLLQIANEGPLTDIVKGSKDSSAFYIALIIIVGVNILVGLINLFTQIYLKNQEKRIHKLNIRESKRLELLEDLYNKLDTLTYFDQTQSSELVSEINKISLFINSKRIYFSPEILKICTDYLDYFKNVVVNYSNKNILTESNHLNEFYRIFNK